MGTCPPNFYFLKRIILVVVVVVTEVLLTMYVIASRRAPIEEALPIPHGYNVPNS